MEDDLKTAYQLNLNSGFEKRKLLQKIDDLEEKLEQALEKNNSSITEVASNMGVRKPMSIAINPMGALLSPVLESIDEEVIIKEAPDSPKFVLPDISQQIMEEVAEEDKDSDFGDYGSSSSDSEESQMMETP